jgi:hypothetical protein
VNIKTADRWFKDRKQFDTLPAGYTLRPVPTIGPNTSRRLTGGGESALYEIASVTPRWTEWGEGHSTSMYSGACERRGYIEVAVPDKPSRGSYLYRATESGVKLANTWRKLRKEPLLRWEPDGHVHEWSEWDYAGAPHGSQRRYCACGSEQTRKHDARGEEWPESLTSWELHEAILVEPDRDRLSMLNAELQARLDATAHARVWRAAL